MSRRRVLIALAVLAALAATGGYLWRQRSAGDLTAPFWLSGNVDVHQVELAFRVTGRIADLKAQEGERVDAGTVLAQLDRVPFENDVAAATADVAQAQAQFNKTRRGFRVEEIEQARATLLQREADLINARVTLERLQNLAPQGMATHQQVDDAQARLAKAQTALGDTTLVAPSRGIISVRAREAGAVVQAGQTVYTLVLNEPVWIRAYVPQPLLGRIKPGMSVKVQTDSMPGKQYDGTVGFISPDAEFTPKTVQTAEVRDDLVYRIRVIAKDPDNVFRQGMPVTVNIAAAQAQTLAGNR